MRRLLSFLLSAILISQAIHFWITTLLHPWFEDTIFPSHTLVGRGLLPWPKYQASHQLKDQLGFAIDGGVLYEYNCYSHATSSIRKYQSESELTDPSILLFLHGGNTLVQSYENEYPDWCEVYDKVFALEYPGYTNASRSSNAYQTGTRADRILFSIRQATEIISDENRRWSKKSVHFTIYGIAVGGGLLSAVLHEIKPSPNCIVFDSAFARLSDVVRERLWNQRDITHALSYIPFLPMLMGFDLAINETYAAHYSGTIVIKHREFDANVPWGLSMNLFASFKHARQDINFAVIRQEASNSERSLYHPSRRSDGSLDHG